MKILVFGSLNIDRTYSVEHFVKPCETISATRLDFFCGGKGFNQAVALARAGCDIYFAGALGEDGAMLENALSESNIRLDYLRHVPGPSGHAVIQLDPSGQNCILISAGANGCIDREYIDYVLSNFREGDYIVLQNEIPSVDYIIQAAKERKMTVVFNPSPFNGQIHKCKISSVDYLMINEVEGAELSGTADSKAMKEALHSAYPDTNIVLTLGAQGVLCIDRDGSEYSCGIYDVPVVDTTAAGDTFTGFFLAEIIESGDIQKALERASIASGIAVSRKGASPSIPCRGEVDSADKSKLRRI